MFPPFPLTQTPTEETVAATGGGAPSRSPARTRPERRPLPRVGSPAARRGPAAWPHALQQAVQELGRQRVPQRQERAREQAGSGQGTGRGRWWDWGWEPMALPAPLLPRAGNQPVPEAPVGRSTRGPALGADGPSSKMGHREGPCCQQLACGHGLQLTWVNEMGFFLFYKEYTGPEVWIIQLFALVALQWEDALPRLQQSFTRL